MARFDVYANPDTQEALRIPYFLDVQNSHLQALATRVVVPLWQAAHIPLRASELNPVLEFQGQSLVMDTASLAAVPVAALRQTVGNLANQQLALQNALDALFGAY